MCGLRYIILIFWEKKDLNVKLRGRNLKHWLSVFRWHQYQARSILNSLQLYVLGGTYTGTGKKQWCIVTRSTNKVSEIRFISSLVDFTRSRSLRSLVRVRSSLWILCSIIICLEYSLLVLFRGREHQFHTITSCVNGSILDDLMNRCM
jgi:hypothetical protein